MVMLNFLSSFRISIFLFISFVVFWICWDTSKEPSRLISLCGLIAYIFLGFLFSKHRDRVRYPSKAEPGTPQISKIGSVLTVVNGFQSLTIVVKLSIIDVCGDLGYTSVLIDNNLMFGKPDQRKNIA